MADQHFKLIKVREKGGELAMNFKINICKLKIYKYYYLMLESTISNI